MRLRRRAHPLNRLSFAHATRLAVERQPVQSKRATGRWGQWLVVLASELLDLSKQFCREVQTGTCLASICKFRACELVSLT